MSARTMLTQDLIEISLESNENLDALIDLIKDKVTEDTELKSHAFYTMCELVWINSQLLFVLKRDLEDLVFKDETQNEILVPETTLQTLVTLLSASHQAKKDLAGMSYSLYLH